MSAFSLFGARVRAFPMLATAAAPSFCDPCEPTWLWRSHPRRDGGVAVQLLAPVSTGAAHDPGCASISVLVQRTVGALDLVNPAAAHFALGRLIDDMANEARRRVAINRALTTAPPYVIAGGAP